MARSAGGPSGPWDLRGKVCLVTGASSGIGKETARGLARMGATVVMAVRDQQKGEAVRADIMRETGNSNVEVMQVDLVNQDSVRRFVAAFKAKHPQLHVLVNNAGTYLSRRVLTPEGLESTFAINHLGPFLLTNLLLDTLKASAPSRIINVSSEAQRSGQIDFDHLRGEETHRGWRAYADSKLANVLFTYELARRLEGTGVTVNALHPGVVRTNFARTSGTFMKVMVRIMAPFMKSPAAGARTSLYLASSPDVDRVTGKYYIGTSPAESGKGSYDSSIAMKLWEVSSNLTGIPG